MGCGWCYFPVCLLGGLGQVLFYVVWLCHVRDELAVLCGSGVCRVRIECGSGVGRLWVEFESGVGLSLEWVEFGSNVGRVRGECGTGVGRVLWLCSGCWAYCVWLRRGLFGGVVGL